MANPVHDYLAEIGRKGGAAGRGPANLGDTWEVNMKNNLVLLLKEAIARIELDNKEGNPILSAWLPDAKAALATLIHCAMYREITPTDNPTPGEDELIKGTR